jgi:malate dehydrogenase (oxaloacetate-decarboxylating)
MPTPRRIRAVRPHGRGRGGHGGRRHRLRPGQPRLRPGRPRPEVDPAQARRHATVVATGRSDFPNQINNVLAFPGIFRGLLDAGAREISDAMLIAAARAIADTVAAGETHAGHIVPSVFDPDVAPAVAAAVRDANRTQA